MEKNQIRLNHWQWSAKSNEEEVCWRIETAPILWNRPWHATFISAKHGRMRGCGYRDWNKRRTFKENGCSNILRDKLHFREPEHIHPRTLDCFTSVLEEHSARDHSSLGHCIQKLPPLHPALPRSTPLHRPFTHLKGLLRLQKSNPRDYPTSCTYAWWKILPWHPDGPEGHLW